MAGVACCISFLFFVCWCSCSFCFFFLFFGVGGKEVQVVHASSFFFSWGGGGFAEAFILGGAHKNGWLPLPVGFSVGFPKHGSSFDQFPNRRLVSLSRGPRNGGWLVFFFVSWGRGGGGRGGRVLRQPFIFWGGREGGAEGQFFLKPPGPGGPGGWHLWSTWIRDDGRCFFFSRNPGPGSRDLVWGSLGGFQFRGNIPFGPSYVKDLDRPPSSSVFGGPKKWWVALVACWFPAKHCGRRRSSFFLEGAVADTT